MHLTLRHLEQVQAMVDAGSEAAEVVNKTKLQFVMLANQFNCYDFVIVKQQLSKFYQDKHIKVSLFIQDKTQASDGVIHLNFVGTNPIHTPIGNKPGNFSFKSGKSGQV